MISRTPPAAKKAATKKSKTASKKKAASRASSDEKRSSTETNQRTAKKAIPAPRKRAGKDVWFHELLLSGPLHLEIRGPAPANGAAEAFAAGPAPLKCKFSISPIVGSTEVNLYKWNSDINDFGLVGRMPYQQALAVIRACKEG